MSEAKAPSIQLPLMACTRTALQITSAEASYNLDDSRARAYWASVGAGGGCLNIFTPIYLYSPFSPSLWETTRYRLKY